jgi:HlyD family secretion protein
MALPRKRWILGVDLLVLAAAAATFWWRGRAVPVDVLQVRMAPLVRTVQFSARVQALSRVDIGATVTGRVSEVLVAEGAQVQAGAELVRLESQELRAALAQALAAQQQATARLAGLRSTGRSSASAALAQAQATVDATQAEFERTRQLVAQGFLSPARQDDARRARDVALAQRDSARAQAGAIGDAGTEIVQAQAAAAAAGSAVEAARARLAQATLRAPADAQVLERAVEPGQIVQPGRSLLTLALAGPTQLVAQVDERFLEQLAVGQVATVVADAYAGQRFAARVLSIAPIVDAQRGAIEVKFALADAVPAFLRQDMTLSVEVETARRPSALAVPVAALGVAPDGKAAVLRVVVDGEVTARPVTTGLRTLDAVEITGGLADGDLVAPDNSLAVGSKVRPVVVPAGPGGGSPRPANASGGSGGAALTNAMGR